MKLSTRVAYNTIIQIVGKILSTILGLIIVAVMTRYLGQTGFGEYTTVITFLSFFAILADLGLTLVTAQSISAVTQKSQENFILGNLFGLRLVSAFIFLSLGPLLVTFFPYEHNIKIGVLLASFSFFFIALNQVFIGLFQKYLRLDKAAIAEVASRIFLLLAVIISIELNFGLVGILIVTSLASAFSFLINYFFSRKFARIKIIFDFKYWRIILSKSWPLAITILFNLIYLKTDTLLLSLIKRPSSLGLIAEVGIYGAAYKVIDVLVTLPFMFAGIILPILTLRWSQNDKEGFKNILQKTFDIMIILALPMVAGTQFIAEKMMNAIAGPDFSSSGPVLQILILAAAIIFLGCMFAHAIIAIGEQKKIISAYIFTALTAVIGYFIFIPAYSYFGAAWVTIYSELTIAFASAYIIFKYAGFRPKYTIFLKSLIASLIMSLILYITKNYISQNLIMMLTTAGVTYFLALYFLKGIAKEDVLVLLNK